MAGATRTSSRPSTALSKAWRRRRIDDVFSALDGDNDGKVTESELSSVLSQLQEQFEAAGNRMRMQGMGGMPPPPPPADDAGFTQDELSAQLEEIGSGDSARSELLSKIVDNFEAADSNGDGKVSFQEAMAYDKAGGSSAAGESGQATAAAGGNSKAQVMRQILELLQAYGVGQSGDNSSLASLLSTSA